MNNTKQVFSDQETNKQSLSSMEMLRWFCSVEEPFLIDAIIIVIFIVVGGGGGACVVLEFFLSFHWHAFFSF